MLATGVWGEGEEWGKGHGDVGVGAEEAERCERAWRYSSKSNGITAGYVNMGNCG